MYENDRASEQMLAKEKELQKKGFRFVSWLGSKLDWDSGEGEMIMKRSKGSRHEFRYIQMNGIVN